jgi:predicted  nucleic acid-binding Zn-ribbon protein
VVRREEADADKRTATITEEIASLQGAREHAAKAVRPDVLKKYSAIHMKKGLAVVAVVSGTCSGCRMRIPPQLFNILQRGNSIELCPTCNRIIYWSKLMEDPDGKPSEPAQS